jgi:hypothetical protein
MKLQVTDYTEPCLGGRKGNTMLISPALEAVRRRGEPPPAGSDGAGRGGWVGTARRRSYQETGRACSAVSA